MPLSAPASASLAAPPLPTAPAGRCPRCEEGFPAGSEACPHCEFSLASARRTFPFSAPPLDFLIDPTQILPAESEQVLREPYEGLRRLFPQVHLSLALLNLAPGTSPREFAFWWFNDAPGETENRPWHLLLLYDAQSGTLGLTPGRALAPLLQGSNWQGALQKVAAAAASTDWRTALHTFLRIVPVLLEADWQHAQPEPSVPS